MTKQVEYPNGATGTATIKAGDVPVHKYRSQHAGVMCEMDGPKDIGDERCVTDWDEVTCEECLQSRPADPAPEQYVEFELLWQPHWGSLKIKAEGKQRTPYECICIDGVTYRFVGYRYAESDVITTVGPVAYWHSSFGKDEPMSSNGYSRECYPIYATHAVYKQEG